MRINKYIKRFFNKPDEQSGGGDPNVEPKINDPFEGLDLELLDDKTKEAVTKAKAELAKIATLEKEKKQFQSGYDQAMDAMGKLQSQLEQQQQPKDKSDPNAALIEDLYEEYRKQGVSDEVARKAAQSQAAVYRVTSKHLHSEISRSIAPVVSAVGEHSVQSAFEQARSVSSHLQVPDVAQEVWELVEKNARDGNLMDAGTIASIAKIKYLDFLENNPERATEFLPMKPTEAKPPTKFNFPGAVAGNVTRPTAVTGKTQKPVSADVAAAVATTIHTIRQNFGLKKK